MLGSRSERIADLIRRELGELIVSRVKDPRIGFVTILAVEMTKDLKFADVHYSVLGAEKAKRSTQAALEHARGYLQREIAQRLKLRLTPVLRFAQSDSLESSLRIDRILKELHGEGRGSRTSR